MAKSDKLQGTLDLLVLKTLHRGPSHGYGIVTHIQRVTDGVLAVEWGTAIEQWMPADHLVVRLRLDDDDARRIELVPHGNWATRPLQEVAV